MIPTLARAGRNRDVLERVGADFVVQAVAGGFTASAISANLSTAIGCAAHIGDWPAAVRCVELSRAAETYESERLDSQVVEYADVPIALLGASAFADRLLYDGRTTVPARAGLQLCAAVDAKGTVAPWKEYLDAFVTEVKNDNTSYGPESDRQVRLAILRGRLRLTTRSRAPSDEGQSDHLPTNKTAGQSNEPPPPVNFARIAAWIEDGKLPAGAVIDAVCDTLGSQAAGELISHMDEQGEFALALAERLSSIETDAALKEAHHWATVSSRTPTAGTTHRLLKLGISIDSLLPPPKAREELFALARQVQDPKAHLEANPILQWLDACAIAARRDLIGLATAEALISGEGWYRCWLRFTAALCRAEAQPASPQGASALEALELLTKDLRPFVGEPRACDLYSLHSVIASTVRRAVALLDDSSWSAGIDILRRVSEGTSVTLSGELGGPLPTDLLLDLIISFTTPSRLTTSEACVTSILRDRTSGRFYSDLASFHLLAARLALAANVRTEATVQWQNACRMLTAYGYRKDATIYELLDPLPALISADRARARERVEAVQPLCVRVPRHTDGRGTRHAPVQWWQILAAADPEAQAKLVATALLRDCNIPHDQLEEARADLWRAQYSSADSLLAAALRLTIEPRLEAHDPEALARLSPLVSAGGAEERAFLQLLLARADERPVRYPFTNSEDLIRRDNGYIARLNAIAEQTGAPHIQPAVSDENVKAPGPPEMVQRTGEERSLIDQLNDQILEDFGQGAVGLARILRAWRRRRHNAVSPRWSVSRFTNAFGYRCIELADLGRTADAEAALRSLADGIRLGDEEGLLSSIAEGLEAHGCTLLAAIAHTFSWTRSRGNSGWLTFGGETAIESLRRAATLNSAIALSVIADEIQRVVRGEWYGSHGISRALIHAFATVDFGDIDTKLPTATWSDIAFSAWDEARAVISLRIPRVGPSDDPSLPYKAPIRHDIGQGERQKAQASIVHPEESTGPTASPVVTISNNAVSELRAINTALAIATLAGLAHPSREQKRRTLTAVKLLLTARSGLLTEAFALSLESLKEPTALSWLLHIVETCGNSAHTVIKHCESQLRAICQFPHLTARAFARRLLTSVGLNADWPPTGVPDPILLRATNARFIAPRIENAPLEPRPTKNLEDTGEGSMQAVSNRAVSRRTINLVNGVAGARLRHAERWLPGLRRAIEVNVERTLSTEAQKSRMELQLEALTSRIEQHWPDAFIAAEEVVEETLQRVVASGRALLAVTGSIVRDPIAWEDNLADILLNEPDIPLALEAAREPRPLTAAPPGPRAGVWRDIRDVIDSNPIPPSQNCPRGATAHDGVLAATVALTAGSTAPTVDTGLYQGWRVLASAEQRIAISESLPRGPDLRSFRYSSVELRKPNDETALQFPPFTDGDTELWWADLPLASISTLPEASTPLIGISSSSDAEDEASGLGWPCSILVPSPLLIAALGLRPGERLLELVDALGAAMTLRTWRTFYHGGEYALARPLLIGVQLLIRPDLFQSLAKLAPATLVWREYVVGDDAVPRHSSPK